MGYTSIKVREEFAEQVRKIIQQKPELGYRTVTDFFIDSVRRRIEQLQQEDAQIELVVKEARVKRKARKKRQKMEDSD